LKQKLWKDWEVSVENVFNENNGTFTGDITPPIPADKWSEVVIAYKPIWAIGTVVVASTKDALKMYKVIRDIIAIKVNPQVAASFRILYGDSVKAVKLSVNKKCPYFEKQCQSKSCHYCSKRNNTIFNSLLNRSNLKEKSQIFS
jgi:triosephosphate isomerase